MISEYIDKVKVGGSLQVSEAEQCLNTILEKDVPDKQIAELLIALSEKGETADEILGFSRALLAKSRPVPLTSNAIDSCGTGGSGLDRFNVSTTAAFVLSAGGVPVIKHGNKGSKRPNGSFDLLEKLGCEFDFEDNRLADIFTKTKVCFLFARTYHPVMKEVVAARQMANRRTIFNLSAPLCNPANPQYQILGTIDVGMGRQLAEVLRQLGRKRFLIVVGEPGIDEVSISGATHIFELTDGVVKEYNIKPSDFGITERDYSTIPGGDNDENAEIFLSLLQNQAPESVLDLVCLNAGAAFYCFGRTDSIGEGFDLSKSLFSKGFVQEKFLEYKRLSDGMD
ncbi:MAG: anthranilate phosphoribosyltransferase [Candidatus Poribacteria bacterium]|nr:anthranilate phosphoribosyltransferase [Candidatus Poribacteria bacterium]